jgi:hypothetical protein
MRRTITKKDTSGGAKSKLASVIRMKVRPTGTTKNAKSVIVWCSVKETFSWSFKIDDFARQ